MKRAWIIGGSVVVVLCGIAVAAYITSIQGDPKTTRPQTTVKVDTNRYVALGDSVASGLGLTAADGTGCGRGKEAYPRVLAEKRGYELHHLACSGATVELGITGSQTAAGETESQLAQLKRAGQPELITLGIGANDVAWLTRLAECAQRTCGTPADQQAYRTVLSESYAPQLRSVLLELGKRYPDTRILVVGYYQVFPEPGTACNDTLGLDDSSLQWARQLRAELSAAMDAATQQTGVGDYIEIDFSGHELCTSDPWIQGLSDPAAYHANAAGQAEIARQLDDYITKKENP